MDVSAANNGWSQAASMSKHKFVITYDLNLLPALLLYPDTTTHLGPVLSVETPIFLSVLPHSLSLVPSSSQ